MAGLLHGNSMVSNVILPCEEVIMTRKVFAVCVVLFGLTGSATPATILVPEDYPTIQGAINAASDSDEIVVSDNKTPVLLIAQGLFAKIDKPFMTFSRRVLYPLVPKSQAVEKGS